MTTATETGVTTQVNRIYIKATAQAVWDAITKPEWTSRYGYGGVVEYDLRPGGAYRAYASDAMKQRGQELGFEVPDLAVDGEVIESDPPSRLVHTFRMLMGGEDMAAEGFTRITWEIEELQPGFCKVTAIHDLEGAPQLAALVSGELETEGAGGGWPEILSGLKTILETGESLRAE
jgi:uncharacterized protein YndB with AHSA1/START domain